MRRPIHLPISLVPDDPPRPWSGDILRAQGHSHRGKPLRIAAWVDPMRRVLAAAIIEGNGPAVLRAMLDGLLATTDRPPNLVRVPPLAKAHFRGLTTPLVRVERDGCVKVMIDDQIWAGHMPEGLPVRRG